MATHSSILAWRIPGQRSLANYTPQGHKELNTIEWLTLSLCLNHLVDNSIGHTMVLSELWGIQVKTTLTY